MLWQHNNTNSEVAPRAGAWIETGASLKLLAPTAEVAPRAGAWIETY